LLRRLECLHANPWCHPLFVLPQLGSAAFSFGYLMTRDWYQPDIHIQVKPAELPHLKKYCAVHS
ncbi:hypothetical protein, partial [Polaromonas hydrogenivorans]|uniref:hypothetical protein n=1 Tax=Polaromonas hydrogenivorans TaxID=335476 RepID=UPI0039F07797